MEYQGFLFVNSIQYSRAVFSVNRVLRQPWPASPELSFSGVFLAPEWANTYKSIKILVSASNFVALTMIKLYYIFTVEYMHPFNRTFFV